MIRLPETIKHILIINILFFIATTVIKNYDLFELFSLHFYENPNFRIWQFVTSIFLHHDFIGLLFNLMGLYFLGTPLLEIWGKNRFIFFYISASIAPALLFLAFRQFEFHNAVNDVINMGISKTELYDLFNIQKAYENPVIETANRIYTMRVSGTSSILYGMLAAYAINNPNGKFYLYFVIPVTVKYFVPVILLISLISSLSIQPIIQPLNNFFYGFFGVFIGLITAYFWKKNQNNMN